MGRYEEWRETNTLCVGVSSLGQKRTVKDSGVGGPANKKAKSKASSSVESLASASKEYELKLKDKHGDAHTPFQCKLWAEMYAKSAHNSLEEPPNAAMFQCQSGKDRRSHASSEQASVMVTVIDKLCDALTPKQTDLDKKQPKSTFSPMERAELRSTYIKQLSDLICG